MADIDRPSIIDVEASGFGPSSYPIEVGLALSTGERYSILILPHPEWTYWDNEAEKIHQVTREILRQHGKPIEEVATKLNKILANKTIYSDGWVVDKSWIDHLFYTARIRQLFSISPLEMILSESQMNLWHDTKIRVIQELNLKRHRASSDALIIQEIYARTKGDNPG